MKSPTTYIPLLYESGNDSYNMSLDLILQLNQIGLSIISAMFDSDLIPTVLVYINNSLNQFTIIFENC